MPYSTIIFFSSVSHTPTRVRSTRLDKSDQRISFTSRFRKFIQAKILGYALLCCCIRTYTSASRERAKKAGKEIAAFCFISIATLARAHHNTYSRFLGKVSLSLGPNRRALVGFLHIDYSFTTFLWMLWYCIWV